mgnify:CR=1 FL=1
MAAKEPQRSEVTPLFVYGSLKRGEGLALLKDAIERQESATARGRFLSTGQPLTAVRFSEDGMEIRGQLYWLRPEAYDSTIEALDRYEGRPRLFERVRITVQSRSGPVAAVAYQWARPGELVGEYLRAVERKIDIARYHASCLEKLLQGEAAMGSEPAIDVQAHFEGVLFAAVAAEDQLAEAINIGLALDLGHASLAKVLAAANRWEMTGELDRWRQRSVAADYREVRRLMTHHWSRKTVKGPVIEVQEVMRGEHRGNRELGAYSRAVVEHFERLRAILPRVTDSFQRGGA